MALCTACVATQETMRRGELLDDAFILDLLAAQVDLQFSLASRFSLADDLQFSLASRFSLAGGAEGAVSFVGLSALNTCLGGS